MFLRDINLLKYVNFSSLGRWRNGNKDDFELSKQKFLGLPYYVLNWSLLSYFFQEIILHRLCAGLLLCRYVSKILHIQPPCCKSRGGKLQLSKSREQEYHQFIPLTDTNTYTRPRTWNHTNVNFLKMMQGHWRCHKTKTNYYNIYTKTRWDVGMDSCMEKTTGQNVPEQGVFCDIVTTQLTFAGFKTHIVDTFCHPYTHPLMAHLWQCFHDGGLKRSLPQQQIYDGASMMLVLTMAFPMTALLAINGLRVRSHYSRNGGDGESNVKFPQSQYEYLTWPWHEPAVP